MGSASENIQDPSANEMSKVNAFTDNALSLDVGLQCVTSVLSKNQFISGNDYALKVRKPYTISKQRERWTEEDHKKFLEALKLYGRAWKHIEEHVGTKTAVQIRSHAQKFFSKVVRESNSSEESIVKPIEIPPPRPKRKPVHPYPRKIVSPVKTGPCLPDEHTRSVSPNSSISGQENQSPTSVLSAIGSNTTGVTDSNMLDRSLSPASFPSETILSPEEYGSENGSSSPTQENGCSAQAEQVEVPMKLELFSEDSALVKEGSSEAVSTRSLKLFGKTVIVSGPSSPNSENCNSQLFEVSEERPMETSCNIKPEVRFTPNDAEHAWTSSSCGASAVYYMQFLNGVLYPFLQLHSPVPEKGYEYSDFNEVQDKELQNDGSRIGSNTGSANVGSVGDKTWDVETHSGLPFVGEVALPETRKSPVKSVKGFVPYKRCLAERDNGSTLKGKERDEQRIRLFL